MEDGAYISHTQENELGEQEDRNWTGKKGRDWTVQKNRKTECRRKTGGGDLKRERKYTGRQGKRKGRQKLGGKR